MRGETTREEEEEEQREKKSKKSKKKEPMKELHLIISQGFRETEKKEGVNCPKGGEVTPCLSIYVTPIKWSVPAT